MQSEIDLLRKRISELEAKKVKNAEVLKRIMEENTEREAESIELKARIEEILKKIKWILLATRPKNDKLKARVAKLEHKTIHLKIL